MKRKQQTVGKGSPKVPGYIVTFSDMTTLLLTFFVMLLSLSSVQDPELFNRGRGAFVESVRYLGLGILYGSKPQPDLGESKSKFFIGKPDEAARTRIIDAREEELRRIFRSLTRSMTALPSQILARRTNFSVADIRFSPGKATLDEPARRFLTQFCAHLRDYREAELQQDPDSVVGTLYVLGLATNQATQKQQWILSARRAQAVADFMRDVLSPDSGSQTRYGETGVSARWHIYWWGAGPGGDWVGQESPISEQSQTMIAVLTGQ